ncbi:hypothetical protein DEO72_LG3g790 [Vigna unguiculata]|uniref:Uncharacterized protein n=1 Tax=Vigna unguiculata TaxID=3917 RepID=A0A4D6LCG8_VIGUN|nr:hypothetical protein DEO72_LG3g790 [Vigna unguiculata]
MRFKQELHRSPSWPRGLACRIPPSAGSAASRSSPVLPSPSRESPTTLVREDAAARHHTTIPHPFTRPHSRSELRIAGGEAADEGFSCLGFLLLI